MKRLFNSKKTLVGIIATLVGVTVLLAGLTLAWWQDSGGTDGENIITLNALSIKAEIWDEFPAHAGGPGATFENMLGSLWNDGSVNDVLARLGFVAEVSFDGGVTYGPDTDNILTLSWQVNGAPLAYKKGVQDGFPVHPYGMWFSNTDPDAFYYWGTRGDYTFVQMEGDHELHFAYTIKMADVIDKDKYDGAQFRVKILYDGIKLNGQDALIASEFGITNLLTDVTWGTAFVFDRDPSYGVGPFSVTDPVDEAISRITNKIASVEDGMFKDFLIGTLAQLNS